MSLHKEIKFETEICEHLAANGWLYAEQDAANYVGLIGCSTEASMRRGRAAACLE